MEPVLLSELRDELKKYWNPAKADFLQKYFRSDEKSSKQIFRGVTVPDSRKIAKQFINLDFNDIQTLLESDIHEERLIALFILVLKFKRADERVQEQIIRFYLKHTEYINDWDLVDSSASNILGMFLLDKKRDILYTLVHSDRWWERRIAVIATLAFIVKQKESHDTFQLAKKLLEDKHDLIHKAVGWMLREIGKRVSQDVEEEFLKKHYKKMPRTMLRYAIEHFPEAKRQKYLKGQL